MKRSIAGILAVLLTLSVTGCGNQPDAPQMPADPSAFACNLAAEGEPQEVSGTEPDAEFLSAQTGFALSLMQQTAAESDGEND